MGNINTIGMSYAQFILENREDPSVLNLNGIGLDSKGLEKLLRDNTHTSFFKELTTLRLNQNLLQDPVPKFLGTLKKLTCIELSNNPLRLESLVQIAQNDELFHKIKGFEIDEAHDLLLALREPESPLTKVVAAFMKAFPALEGSPFIALYQELEDFQVTGIGLGFTLEDLGIGRTDENLPTLRPVDHMVRQKVDQAVDLMDKGVGAGEAPDMVENEPRKVLAILEWGLSAQQVLLLTDTEIENTVRTVLEKESAASLNLDCLSQDLKTKIHKATALLLKEKNQEGKPHHLALLSMTPDPEERRTEQFHLRSKPKTNEKKKTEGHRHRPKTLRL